LAPIRSGGRRSYRLLTPTTSEEPRIEEGVSPLPGGDPRGSFVRESRVVHCGPPGSRARPVNGPGRLPAGANATGVALRLRVTGPHPAPRGGRSQSHSPFCLSRELRLVATHRMGLARGVPAPNGRERFPKSLWCRVAERDPGSGIDYRRDRRSGVVRGVRSARHRDRAAAVRTAAARDRVGRGSSDRGPPRSARPGFPRHGGRTDRRRGSGLRPRDRRSGS